MKSSMGTTVTAATVKVPPALAVTVARVGSAAGVGKKCMTLIESVNGVLHMQSKVKQLPSIRPAALHSTPPVCAQCASIAEPLQQLA